MYSLQILNARAALAQQVDMTVAQKRQRFAPVTFLQRRWDAAFKIQLWARVCMAKGKVYMLRDKRRELVRRNNAAVWMQV
jgi:hypothetical protein